MAGGLSQFMFGNQSPSMVTSTGTGSSAIPDWLTQYSQGLLSGANTLIPQTASNLQTSQSPLTQAAPYLSSAQGITTGAINPANSGSVAASPYFSGATSGIGTALNPATGGVSAAAPYLNRASGAWTDPGVAQSYMNPYEQNVTNLNAQLAGQQFNDYVMPQVEDQFINSGQFGSSNMGRSLGLQLKQLGTNLNAQNLAQLAQGYQSGEGTYQSDLARQGALAQTAGSLGTQAQGLGLQGASELGSLGTAAGTLATQQQGAQLQGAQQLGALGQTAGQLGAAGNTEQLAQLGLLGQLGASAPRSTVQNYSQTTPYNPATYGVQGTSPLSQILGLQNGTGALGGALGSLQSLFGGSSGAGYAPTYGTDGQNFGGSSSYGTLPSDLSLNLNQPTGDPSQNFGGSLTYDPYSQGYQSGVTTYPYDNSNAMTGGLSADYGSAGYGVMAPPDYSNPT